MKGEESKGIKRRERKVMGWSDGGVKRDKSKKKGWVVEAKDDVKGREVKGQSDEE